MQRHGERGRRPLHRSCSRLAHQSWNFPFRGVLPVLLPYEDTQNCTPAGDLDQNLPRRNLNYTDGCPSFLDMAEPVPEHKAVKRNAIEEVKALIKKNKNAVFLLDNYEQTMLHVACFEGLLDMAIMLLKYYKAADLKLRDKNGWTALHCAASQGHLEIYELLLSKGASPNAQNGDLTSPFAYMCRHRWSDKLHEMLDASIKKGADPDMQNRYGETPLHAACAKGNIETAMFLLEKGANVGVFNLVGETPLHKAVRCGDNALKLCQLLVERGADISVSGYTGTALSLAIASRVDTVEEYLRQVQAKNHKESSKKKKPDELPEREGSKSELRSAQASAGPSLDNIDLAALLSIRGEEQSGNAFGFVQSDKPGEDDLLEEDPDFNLDLGRDYIQSQEDDMSEAADLRIEDDNYLFNYGDDPANAVNIIGELNLPFGKEPFLITVLKTPGNSKFRGVIRTKTGDHRFFIPAALFSASQKNKPVSDKHILKELKAALPELCMKGTKLSICTDPKLQEELVYFESMKKKQLTCMKVGVMYCKKGQKTEEEMFGNEHGSESHDQFLSVIGERIKLQGFKGYKGDLDVVDNRTGLESVVTQFQNLEVMFHVSTLLPYSPGDPQQIPRKKFIGNDLSTIVFLEEGATFRPPTVSGDFLHVFAAVQPCKTKDGKPGYRLAIASRKGVPPFGPLMPKPAIFPAEGTYFRDFLLTKILNGERAALHSPFLASKMRKTRQNHLQHLVDRFLRSD